MRPTWHGAGAAPGGSRDLPSSLELDLQSAIVAHSVQKPLKPCRASRNIVAVGSAKGGVGKSTVAVNLALAWAAAGARVGMLDADIYGPSQPLMLGVAGQRPTSVDGKRIRPLEAHGMKADVHRLADRSGPAGGLARADGDPGADAVAGRNRMGRARLPRRSTCRPAPATCS